MSGIFNFRIIATELKALSGKELNGMSNKEKYNIAADLQEALPLFFKTWWLNIVSSNWDVALVEKEDKIVAVFPYNREQKLGLTILRNPVLTPFLGPFFFYPENLSSFKKINWEEQIFEKLWNQLPTWHSFDIQSTTLFNNFILFHQKDFVNNNRLTYHIDLSLSSEVLFRNIQSSHRKRIEQTTEIYKIEEGVEYTQHLMDLHEKTFRRKGKKYVYSKTLLSEIIQKSYLHQSGKLLAAKDENGHVMGTIFIAWDKEQAYLLLSAVDAEQSHKGTICLLIWQAILEAQKSGLKIFDFEGSMDAGIEPFFRRFGGERKTFLHLHSDKSKIWKLKKTIMG
jgi:hypothetical protein